ncbi:hypothetical protein PF004_g9985 [Phytophthora fragariae]|uniref:Uncharacterized protein n=1 Tax=Phytophthora fragariae TaxID=53985 RepID=A0A6G0P2D1_9STRA|nr:hypothetical protein PF004_g9985 [Phytophthora fragariae]
MMLVSSNSELQLSSSPSLGKISLPLDTPSSESGAHALSALASLLYGLRVVTKINADWTLVFASACLWLLLGASGAVRCGHSKRCQCFHASPMPSIHPRQI